MCAGRRYVFLTHTRTQGNQPQVHNLSAGIRPAIPDLICKVREQTQHACDYMSIDNAEVPGGLEGC